MTSDVFHEGERAVQARAGVAALAERIGRSIRRDIPPAGRTFLAERRWIVMGALDDGGRPWIALRSGPTGFAEAVDGRTVRIQATAPVGEGLGEDRVGDDRVGGDRLRPGTLVGLIALDPATRRRLRVNGRVVAHDAAGLVLGVDQAFANCPKYIQRREESAVAGTAPVPVSLAPSVALTDAQRDRVRATDTFFIASARPGEGVDVSHRGGMPGFVAVDGQRLSWPDYSGNAMFTTLGNLHAHPYAALLIPDFDRGGALVVAGRTTIDWSAAGAATFTGAERVVTLDVDQVVEQTGVLPGAFQLREYSPFNPR